ncbi:4145_t:CDS:1 [Paraglomus brasilianum]|uniref:4145_t:CDS:1 n=1 Tax=Paraglomus brasilianum TaxID=144538 RepID=A0A9N9DQY2_9GLOM|nr:4145_t:CDS:1 [Paraglomus brasilianum]
MAPPLPKDSTNHEPSEFAAAHLATALPNTGYYDPNDSSNKPTMVELNRPVEVLPGANSQAVDPATGIPYMVATTRREGCTFTCSWEMAVSVFAVLLILVGIILLGVGLSNCDEYYCDPVMYGAGIALLCIGVFMGISVIVVILVRRHNRVTTTINHS